MWGAPVKGLCLEGFPDVFSGDCKGGHKAETSFSPTAVGGPGEARSGGGGMLQRQKGKLRIFILIPTSHLLSDFRQVTPHMWALVSPGQHPAPVAVRYREIGHHIPRAQGGQETQGILCLQLCPVEEKRLQGRQW